jgi:hypothetical protein
MDRLSWSGAPLSSISKVSPCSPKVRSSLRIDLLENNRVNEVCHRIEVPETEQHINGLASAKKLALCDVTKNRNKDSFRFAGL